MRWTYFSWAANKREGGHVSAARKASPRPMLLSQRRMKRSKVVAMDIAPGPERWRLVLLASLPALAFLLGC